MKAGKGQVTKAQSLYKDTKDYTFRMFKDFDTYKRLALDLNEVWSPSGGDIDTILFNELNFKQGVKRLSDLTPLSDATWP